MKKLVLWIAQGFGAGRIPVAPGTFGSLVGLLWFALLLFLPNSVWFAVGVVAGLGFSVWFCGVAEQMIGQKDPGSVVLDEMAAIPLCFAGWIVVLVCRTGSLPAPGYFFSKQTWWLTLGIFVAFRFFDVVKPWPVRQSQALIGGWGITVDDALAAVYVNAVVLAVWGGTLWLNR